MTCSSNGWNVGSQWSDMSQGNQFKVANKPEIVITGTVSSRGKGKHQAI